MKPRKEHTVSIENLAINYIDEGSGPVLLFLHNGGGFWQVWEKQIAFFSKANRVIALDWPSFGKSETTTKPLSISTYSHFLKHFIAALQLEKVHLIGNCIGSSIAIKYAQEQPSQIQSLTLFNVCPGNRLVKSKTGQWFLNVLEKRKFVRTLTLPFFHFVFKKTPVRRKFPSVLFGKEPDKTDPLFLMYAAKMKQKKQSSGRLAMIYDVNSFSIERFFKAPLPLPTRLFWGAENQVAGIADQGVFFSEVLQQKLVPIPKSGHLCMYEQPEHVNVLLNTWFREQVDSDSPR